MKHLLITLLLVFSVPSYAMGLDHVQKQVRKTPEMSAYCVKKIEKNKKRVKFYEDRIALYKERKWKISKLDKIKLFHFKAELQNWIDYCTGKADEEE